MAGADSWISLQVMSDLHLETPRFLPMYESFQITPSATHLALLGDIGNAFDGRLLVFLEENLQKFEIIFYILGNHEPYANNEAPGTEQMLTADDAREKLVEFEKRVEALRIQNKDSARGRFVFMDRRRFDVDDKLTILGCTLFSHISQEQESTVALFVSDFSNIHGWTTSLHNAAHARDLAWLNSQVEDISSREPDRAIVILTHHSPSVQPQANNPDHLEDPKGVHSAFVSDLSKETCWQNLRVKVWAFGHTHWNCDFIDQDTGKRVLSNQRGYGREDIFDFDPSKVISLGGFKNVGSKAKLDPFAPV